MKTLRIGTRDSALAVWQAATVARALEAKGYKTELVEVKSAGDLDLSTPLSQFGSTGVFTKILDEALYQDKADIAVHSLKDYPTQAPEGIVMAAVLERGPVEDILVHKGNLDFLDHAAGKVATGSIRRIAQWKARYPEHDNPGLRGNVQTRLQKLADNDWHGAIFAKAGLERLNLLPEHYEILDWMIPAPAQGIVGITCLESKGEFQEILHEINHANTALRAKVERDFLRTVEGGCSAPVGAYAEIEENQIRLQAGVFSLDGKEKVRLENAVPLSAASELGISMAQEALKRGAAAILEKIKHD
ncbi:hydroxymethylbilane synthase [Croceimicrobium hydrocarbonivorans]|uniref:Hydroxymethylbilane synthase n=1 Tax=Croceimicrobium hydrocarbonivorans TaxID=2761580 RepID=A0A7H0VGS0_9FLAO|nr:hydroxymethylbilane synthase [Croceimicrobium hydrocarbonivorans]QNR24918.1 hydroxymethylbilane synthase [Croceimicrobium hydrocarbonivorans]